MFNFHRDHRALANASFFIFLALSIGIAVMPAYQMQDNNGPLPGQPKMTAQEHDGQKVFIAEGCVACHTQQVRNIPMDKMWGDRPSIPSDYYYGKERMSIWQQTPSVLGSERTGPDLTNVGVRQSGMAWQMMHLHNPRSVVKESIMPSYPWLFVAKQHPSKDDVVVPVGPGILPDTSWAMVATKEAKDLVAYLLSLKQTPLPTGEEGIPFLASDKSGALATVATDGTVTITPSKVDGKALYMRSCSACHQNNGMGVPGAFPPLAGSPIVNDKDPNLMIQIILLGYDARPQWAAMTPFADLLTDEEIAAIMTHERTSWGNTASAITMEQVKSVRDSLSTISASKP